MHALIEILFVAITVIGALLVGFHIGRAVGNQDKIELKEDALEKSLPDLHRIYFLLLEGQNFHADYDRASHLIGVLRRHLELFDSAGPHGTDRESVERMWG